jgi:hypothetical protein
MQDTPSRLLFQQISLPRITTVIRTVTISCDPAVVPLV